MRIVCLCLLLAVALLAADASEPHISDLLISRQGSELLLSFQLVNAFDDPLLERIQSGLPTSFHYHVKLERLRRWWFNNTVSRSELQVVAMYNAITREYLVNYKLDGRLIESRVVKSEEELERAMTEFHALSLLELPDVGGRLVARVRVELGSKTILGLIPTTRHTEWAESERFHAQGETILTTPDSTDSP